jgi:hypothetical protein
LPVPAVPGLLLPPLPGLSLPAAPDVVPPDEPAEPVDVPGPLWPHPAAKRNAPEHATKSFFTWSSQFRPIFETSFPKANSRVR